MLTDIRALADQFFIAFSNINTRQDISFSYSALTGQPTPPPLQAPAAFTLPVTTTERLSSSVASSEQLAPSSTVLETSATATESMSASSAGLEPPTQTMTATKPTEQTQIASPAQVVSEGHSTSSELTADGTDDGARPCRATPLLHLHLLRLRFLALDAKGGESLEYDRVRGG